jgi:hypothetical protein
MRDSIRRGFAKPHWWLSDIEHGFEINSGNVVGMGDKSFGVKIGRRIIGTM